MSKFFESVDKSEEYSKYLKKLQGIKTLHIETPDTNITFDVTERKWILCDGKLNMPDGEIYTSPIENSANGYIKFDYPACYYGVEVEGLYLEIKDGKIIKATADKNEDFLLKTLDTDEGSKFIGEVAFGINENIKCFSKSILFDEKIGGTMHLAIGASYPDAGGLNKSGIHWDIVKDMKKESKVFADGIMIYQNGKFVE